MQQGTATPILCKKKERKSITHSGVPIQAPRLFLRFRGKRKAPLTRGRAHVERGYFASLRGVAVAITGFVSGFHSSHVRFIQHAVEVAAQVEGGDFLTVAYIVFDDLGVVGDHCFSSFQR